jgi:hypothetical protein
VGNPHRVQQAVELAVGFGEVWPAQMVVGQGKCLKGMLISLIDSAVNNYKIPL